MADTITIGGTIYHKLVTFRDCAGRVSGANALFPDAFMELQEDGNYFDATEIVSNRCIHKHDLKDTF